jgi:hypothetical protein
MHLFSSFETGARGSKCIKDVQTCWCRRIWVWWCWVVRLHNNGPEILGAGGSAQNWQEIVIWLNLGNFRVHCSNLAITLATSIRFAHMTPIQKALFGAHVVATELCSVRLVLSPKIRCFPCQNPNFRYFFSIYGNFSFIISEVILSPIWARFSTEYLFYYVFRFIRVFGILLFLAKIRLNLIFSYLSPACGRFFDSLLLLINYQNSEFSLCFGVNFLVSSLQIICWLAYKIIVILFRRHLLVQFWGSVDPPVLIHKNIIYQSRLTKKSLY